MSVTRRVTIMVIPETGKRTLSLSFAPVWLLTLPLLFVCVAVYAYLQFSQNQMLVQQVHELDQLRRTNRLQEAQIESIQGKVMSTEKKLEVLQQLEQQIREITEQGMSSSRSGAPALPAAAGEGRGGPMPTAAPQSSLPTLNALLPPEARAHLLGKRDTLPLHMIEPSTHQSNPERTAQQAIEAEVLVNDQEAELTRLADSLDTGKRAIEAQMDYIAHRPTGLPVSGAQLTDRFGSRWSPFGWGEQLHEGVDLALWYGEPAVATAAGTVVHAGWMVGGYGYTVVIDHGYGFTTLYAHFDEVNSSVGDVVSRGDVIGWVGSTGNSTGPHVHYEVHVNGVPVDPMRYAQ